MVKKNSVENVRGGEDGIFDFADLASLCSKRFCAVRFMVVAIL